MNRSEPSAQHFADIGYESDKLPNTVIDEAIDLLDELPDGALTGRNPRRVFAGAVYASSLVLGEKFTQKTVATAFSMSTSSVANHYQAINEAIHLSTYDPDSP